jgi:hypothetical protein
MNINERLSLFANELNDIQDNNLRQFAVQLLVNAPEYFFTVPASSSGKYHPYFAREVGGLVKHTRCVIFYAECNAESFNFDSHIKDLAIIAALAHDIKKQGNNNTGSHTVWEHPELAYNFILETQKNNPDLITVEDATIIANAILCHMGKWQHDAQFTRGKKAFPLPTTLFDYAIQSADYMASRVELTGFAFRPTDGVIVRGYETLNEEKTTVETSPVQTESVPSDVGDTIFPFGKHAGKTIREVAENHPDYIDWMINKANFNNTDMLDKVKLYIEQKKN